MLFSYYNSINVLLLLTGPDSVEGAGAGPEVRVLDPGVPQQDVEAAVGGELQVDRPRKAGGERLQAVRVVGVEGLDPALDEIGEEVPALVVGREAGAATGRAEGTASDRGDRVMMDRAAEPRVGRRALGQRPAVVAPAIPSSISSQRVSPTSLRKIRPVPGCTAKLNGLRSPSAQMARYFPRAVS